jgi:soluble lytic murein transglycosylase-like protein
MLEDDRSYGLMQLLGSNARRICEVPPGVGMGFSWLLDPSKNIACAKDVLLYELKATGGNVSRALARYNGGPTGEKIVLVGGLVGRVNGKMQMRCQGYVDLIRKAAARVEADRAAQVLATTTVTDKVPDDGD